jgi:ABC-2 type transport system ATP-binding protein
VTGRRLLEYHGALRGDTRSAELLELFDPPLERPVRQFSSGNRQMLAIILAFMHDPELVILDEPTAGLDPLKQERFVEFVRAEQERGTTFFFSSHILSEVRKVCDRVAIIRDGRLAELEDVQTLLQASGKTVRVRLAGALEAADIGLDGAHDLEVVGDSTTSTEDRERATTLSFTYTGGYEALLGFLQGYEILDLTIEEAPLEEVFMRFYGEDPSSVVDRVESEEAGP